ncbi:MAG: GDP-mannose-dependent alpha-mannosyltransferase [Rhodomicrobium sp.]|nr:MAG: GDP-mannose-dependent alpha-mannosyltransferase [Rhodomicrobium sp.]
MPLDMRILIATDAWTPQVNGVVRTYQRVEEALLAEGHEVFFATPDRYRTVPCPTYPEIRLSLVTAWQLDKLLDEFSPDAVHIATEGPIGWAARRACLKQKRPFTTAYHTRFPEYVAERVPVPVAWIYKMMRVFHNASNGTMVATKSLGVELEARGFTSLLPWTRGVDTEMFHPRQGRVFGAGPVALYVGRVAPEKNIEAFLDLDIDLQKVVVGDGPSLEELEQSYPDVTFTGALEGEALAAAYSAADVFVFPSKTDTFGIVMLEAMASGLPVAAFPVTGPIDVIEDGVTGALDDDLKTAILRALELDRQVCLEKAAGFSWAQCGALFLENLKPVADVAVVKSVALPKRSAFPKSGK